MTPADVENGNKVKTLCIEVKLLHKNIIMFLWFDHKNIIMFLRSKPDLTFVSFMTPRSIYQIEDVFRLPKTLSHQKKQKKNFDSLEDHSKIFINQQNDLVVRMDYIKDHVVDVLPRHECPNNAKTNKQTKQFFDRRIGQLAIVCG